MWDVNETNIQKMRIFAKTLLDEALHENGDLSRTGSAKIIIGD